MSTPPPIAVPETPAMLHSVAEFLPLIRHFFLGPYVHSVCEVGAEQGLFTAKLAHYLREECLQRVTVVDPVLSEPVKALAADPRLHLVEMISLAALPEIGPHDLYVLDGDHNYYTISHELLLIRGANPNAIVLLHDTGWPCGRRDHYYDPARLPASAVHPHTHDLGIVPNAPGVGPRGMVSLGQYAVALKEGGEANGVMTAVEDFAAGHPDMRAVSLNVIHGLTILYPVTHPLAWMIHDTVMPNKDCRAILERMEANRLRNWIALVDAQQKLEAQRQAAAVLQKHLSGSA